MATLEQVEDAIRKAAAKGDKALVRDLAKAREQLMNAKPNLVPDEGRIAQKGVGGLADYLPEPVVSGLQTFQDVTDSASDAVTGGFVGKTMPGAREQVDEARGRLGNWHYPGDIIASIATSPVKTKGPNILPVNMIMGGADAALDTYGHQDNWIPSGQDALEIGKSALMGSGLSFAGDMVGRGVGKVRNMFKSNPSFSSADELIAAGEKAGKRKSPGAKSLDTMARAERVKAAQLANEKGRVGFEDLTKNMGDWPHKEQVLVERMANNKAAQKSELLNDLGGLIKGGNWPGQVALASMAGPAMPMIGSAMQLSSKFIPKASNKGTYKELIANILDNNGRMKGDKQSVEAARNFFTRMLLEGGETKRRNE